MKMLFSAFSRNRKLISHLNYKLIRNFSLPSFSRVYQNVNVAKPQEYWDYDNLELEFGDYSKYEIIERVGHGKYSDVYEGIDITNNEHRVIKMLKPVKPMKIKREIKVLQQLNNCPFISKLYDVIKNPETDRISLVLSWTDNINYRLLYRQMKDFEARSYLYKLLYGIECSHKIGIIHRDIKPHNVMYDKANDKLSIIDWGLADYYYPGHEYNVRVATRYYKSPELLVGYGEYNYSLDLWSFGCCMGSIIFQREPMFRGRDNTDQLIQIIKILGSNDFTDYITKYKIELGVEFDGLIGVRTKKPFSKFVNETNHGLIDEAGLDLLSQLLKYDHVTRITAQEALKHPYFDRVRDEINEEIERMKVV